MSMQKTLTFSRLTAFAAPLFAAALLVASTPGATSVSDGAKKWRAGDWSGAVREWAKPAAAGDPDAMFNMGQAYRLGRGVQQNHQLALEYYRRAAEKNHMGAIANLGIILFQDGKRTEALSYLRRAADAGEMRAAYVLGVATFSGDGAPRNPTLGYAYILRARDAGLPQAGRQAARMATMLSAADRAKGEAAAAALAAGEPVPVELVGQTGLPAPAAAPSAPAQVAEAPAPAPQAEERPAAAENGFYVQLGAYTNEQLARTAWASLVAQSADILQGQKPFYTPKGRLTALQVGPFAERSGAAELCTRLAAAGRPCFVTRR